MSMIDDTSDIEKDGTSIRYIFFDNNPFIQMH